jgi:hypothetical protein
MKIVEVLNIGCMSCWIQREAVMFCVTIHRRNLLCVSHLMHSYLADIKVQSKSLLQLRTWSLTDGQPDNRADAVFLDLCFPWLWFMWFSRWLMNSSTQNVAYTFRLEVNAYQAARCRDPKRSYLNTRHLQNPKPCITYWFCIMGTRHVRSCRCNIINFSGRSWNSWKT